MSTTPTERLTADQIIAEVRRMREHLGTDLHEQITASLYEKAAAITSVGVRVSGKAKVDWDLLADKILTSRYLGFPIMLLGLTAIFWLTISGANVPSNLLATGLFWIEAQLAAGMDLLGAPWWLTGFLVHGVYRGLAWVVAVMLPPMMIFFPLFTFLEDVGYLPRVAFNLDRIFRWSGAHGKQALTMGMGFGCNAAGVIACRIIDSPRERMIAILTNNFMLCNGRWPTIILLSTVFIAASLPPVWSSIAAVGSVVAIVLIGVVVTFLIARLLSSTVLKGTSSTFHLELPPYRRPAILRIIHRSMIDRTLFVLGRACVTAAPAGAVIWLLGNIQAGDASLMTHAANFLDPAGHFMGLDGIIILAYIIAIPANEIIVPTIIMGYLGAGGMMDLDSTDELGELFVKNGWTLLTALCVMLFALLHYPCATTTWTIWRETRSVKWTLVANLMPLGLAIGVCAAVAAVGRSLGWG